MPPAYETTPPRLAPQDEHQQTNGAEGHEQEPETQPNQKAKKHLLDGTLGTASVEIREKRGGQQRLAEE
jgi:hypothetical protein